MPIFDWYICPYLVCKYFHIWLNIGASANPKTAYALCYVKSFSHVNINQNSILSISVFSIQNVCTFDVIILIIILNEINLKTF